ncbi:hypothetical protein [Candidatus Mycolicibacterium alkanivorans]|uniref:Uncharacterized protein n=1 Tax=Candidatus Mycolicibacterium alkanivorans TaxID=2954114 RepID=A0ABS9YXN4_9MYCO|nr:hypothetical protein [Candidatus Mycolicibacterium alkanivorans]MCI4675099.1 hypothetical protein [Candidatus Mycolicibacterium alkanivorans]
MRTSLLCGRALTASLLVSASALFTIPVASADPDAQTNAPGPAPDPASVNAPAPPLDAPPPDVSTFSAVSDACKQFGAALNFAATNYEDFAYNTAGNGNSVNYQDPNVANSNVIGRTALREAAAAAMSAASTPGLPDDVAAPMRSWSLHAAKLLVIMGIRGGGDSLNSTANDMNTDANNAQMACALNGAHA